MCAKSNILLEAGTNELEVLVFSSGGGTYGVNVAKVREVIMPIAPTPVPDTHPCVMGAFTIRNEVVTLVDLAKVLGKKRITRDDEDGQYIVMEFNDTRIAFYIDDVEQIHRIPWDDIDEVPQIDGIKESMITSVTKIGERMILMLDFEQIIFTITGDRTLQEQAEQIGYKQERSGYRLVLAEDSPTIRQMIRKTLTNAGYENVESFTNGGDAWRYLSGQGAGQTDLIITDIEMPQMDGLHMTKRIRELPQLKDVPVVIFSSLVSVDNEKKCQAVGANAQITKPQLSKLVELVDDLVGLNK